MMQRYAAVAGLRAAADRPGAVLTPRLSSLWVGLVTPVPAALARPLVESLRNEVVCAEHDIAAYVPDPPGGLIGFDQRRRAGAAPHRRRRRRRPAGRPRSGPGAPSDPLPTDPDWAGGSLYTDERDAGSSPPARTTLWRVIEGIGGEHGWYSFPLAWARPRPARPARRRRRAAPRPTRPGPAATSARRWTSGGSRSSSPDALLRLRAEMRLPGLAWLELRVEPDDAGRTVYHQRALFHPARAARAALLVVGAAVPRDRLRRRWRATSPAAAEQPHRGEHGRTRTTRDRVDPLPLTPVSDRLPTP